MSRLSTPASIDATPASAHPLREAVNKLIGSVPNLFRLVANCPAAMEGYLGMSGALAKGSLPAPTRERIALAVAQINDCGCCLSAHSYGNEDWAFGAEGLMHTRIVSINDLPIAESERLYRWPAGQRPDDHSGHTELGLRSWPTPRPTPATWRSPTR